MMMECSALVPLDTMITQNLRRPREFFLKFYQPSFDFLKYKKDETNSLFDEVEKRGAEILAKENALVYFFQDVLDRSRSVLKTLENNDYRFSPKDPFIHVGDVRRKRAFVVLNNIDSFSLLALPGSRYIF